MNSKSGWSNSIKIKLSHKSIKAVRHFWLKPKPIGRSWYPKEVTSIIKLILTTDASDYAWGGFLREASQPQPEKIASASMAARGAFIE